MLQGQRGSHVQGLNVQYYVYVFGVGMYLYAVCVFCGKSLVVNLDGIENHVNVQP